MLLQKEIIFSSPFAIEMWDTVLVETVLIERIFFTSIAEIIGLDARVCDTNVLDVRAKLRCRCS